MLRADNVMCGISTNGTGAQTLAACPSSIGGLDFFKWLTATGYNFVNGNTLIPVSYTIVEYVSLPGGAAIQSEKGVGTITLGASITGCSLVRTTVQSTITGMNTSTPTPTFSLNISSYTYNSGTGLVTLTMAASVSFSAGNFITVSGLNIAGLNGSFASVSASGTTVTYTAATGLAGSPSGGGSLVPAISIGTAANTLVFVGASVADLMPSTGPFFDDGGFGYGLAPPWIGANNTPTYNGFTSPYVLYVPFKWQTPMFVKRMTVKVAAGYTGGTQNVYGAIYAIGTNGRPGKLLVDFGRIGDFSSAFTTIQSTAIATGFMLSPGFYYAAIFSQWSGGSGGPPTFYGCNTQASDAGSILSAGWGSFVATIPVLIQSADTANPAPDPATITGGGNVYSLGQGGGIVPAFFFGP